MTWFQRARAVVMAVWSEVRIAQAYLVNRSVITKIFWYRSVGQFRVRKSMETILNGALGTIGTNGALTSGFAFHSTHRGQV